MKNIAIFASGGGSNAQKIIEYFQGHKSIRISLIVTNKEDAGVLKFAEIYEIPSIVVSKKMLNEEKVFCKFLNLHEIDFIVLAGFLLLIPSYLVRLFPNKIFNIHPSLLPKFGGKGMHGIHVHEAVVLARESKTGLTIHLIDEEYDKGVILLQKEIDIEPLDDASNVAKKVLKLEHKYYASTIEKYIESLD